LRRAISISVLVVEDDGGRDALRLGELEPAAAQGLEQRLVGRLVERGARLAGGWLGRAALSRGVVAQLDAPLAAQYRAAVGAEP